MLLPQPLIPGRLIRRYNRFLADVELESGETVTAHCPNSGSMKGCNFPGSEVLLSRSSNPNRRLPFTWELVKADGHWVGINTIVPNPLVKEAVQHNLIPELSGYGTLRCEVKYGKNSRIDLLLEEQGKKCYVEIKNVTLIDDGLAKFPDAVTERGQKHLVELMEVVRQGARGVIFFLVQRADGSGVAPADAIDPAYGRLLRLAAECGVEPLAYRAKVTPQGIELEKRLPVILV